MAGYIGEATANPAKAVIEARMAGNDSNNANSNGSASGNVDRDTSVKTFESGGKLTVLAEPISRSAEPTIFQLSRSRL